MIQSKAVGRNAASLKYDLISAMGAFALTLGKTEQRRVLRLITLITARYNWTRNHLCVGQREISKLWSCDERTVKREMANLRARGWLVLKRQGARGRVAEYGIDTAQMLADTRVAWEAVGPDLVHRLDPPDPDASVVPLQAAVRVDAPDIKDGTEWALAQAVLFQTDSSAYGTWLAALKRVGCDHGRLTLKAPSRFHAAYVQTHLEARILAACQSVDASVEAICMIA
ncbi:MAG: DnaA N-terminal domain-containing protein [Sedimentitalea sp.]